MELLKEKDIRNKQEKKKYRESNFELLRIIAMIMIVFHHLAVHSGFNFLITDTSLNKLWIHFIRIGGKIGVNIFVLISGYFLVGADKIKISKILKLWGQIFFTSITIYFIFILSGVQEFETKVFIKTLFPIINETWWFASAYFLLYIISPFLNIILKNINKGTYVKIFCFMIAFWCIIPTFFEKYIQFNNLIWFIVLYSVAGYIKLYNNDWKINNKSCFLVVIIIMLVYCILTLISFKIPSMIKGMSIFFEMEKLPIFLISLFIFLGFKESKIRYSESINKIATTTFGIYLIHDNSYVRYFIWNNLFKVRTFQDSNLLIPYSICVCFLVFFTCMLIDLIRNCSIEKYYMKIVYKIEEEILNNNYKKKEWKL